LKDSSHPDCTAFGCIPHVTDVFQQSKELQGNGGYAFFWFVFNFLAFPLNPHMVQRAVISKSDAAVRTTMQVLCVAAFLTMIPGISVGIITATYRDAWPWDASLPSVGAFSAMNNMLKRESFVLYSLVAILTCAALAAIISTADSVVLGVSNALTVDIYKGLINPAATSQEVVSFGNKVSLTFVCASVVYAYYFVTSAGFGSLITLQNGIILQIVPAFFCGLYFESVSAKSLISGVVTGLVVLPVALFVLPSWLVPVWLPAPNLSATANFIVTAAMHLSGAKDEDPTSSPNEFQQLCHSRFDKQITLEGIKKLFEFGVEPSQRGKVVAGLLFLASFPWLPWIIEDVEVKNHGFPGWAMYVLVMSVVAAAAMFIVLAGWKPGPPPLEKEKDPVYGELELKTQATSISML